MSENEMKSRLSRLHPRLRVAFAAKCAERALPIATYQSLDSRSLSQAIELCWGFAINNEVVFPLFDDLYDDIESTVPNVELTPPKASSSMVWQSVLAALDAVTDSAGSSSANSAICALDALDLLTDYLELDRSDSEVEWQEKAIGLVDSWGERQIDRQMFDAIGNQPPTWWSLIQQSS